MLLYCMFWLLVCCRVLTASPSGLQTSFCSAYGPFSIAPVDPFSAKSHDLISFTPTDAYPKLLNEGVVLHLHTFLHYTHGLFSTTPHNLILCCTRRHVSTTPHIIFFVVSPLTSASWHPHNFHQLCHVPSFTTPSHASPQRLEYLFSVAFVDSSPWISMGFSLWHPYRPLFHDTRSFWT